MNLIEKKLQIYVINHIKRKMETLKHKNYIKDEEDKLTFENRKGAISFFLIVIILFGC
jgi:hypothetical protein